MENERTQPARRHRVFNNPRALAEGWYPVCAAKTLRSNKPVSFKLLGQRLAVFRDAQGRPRALDAFCPHMGADLANGSVDGGGLRCFFHGWRFGGDGCLDRASCGEAPAGDVRLNSYPCEEKYGHVWVYAAREAPGGVPSPAGLEGESVSVLRESSALLAHHHLMMANGIDLRHFGSVHGLPVAFEHRVVERGGGVFDWEVEGAIRGEGLLKKIIGPKLGYVARFAGGSWVAVTYLPDHRVLPALHIVWGCEPLESGVSRVRVFLVAKKRPGLLGRLAEWSLLAVTAVLLHMLKDDDRKGFANMRYSLGRLTPADASVAQFVRRIDELPLSPWSPELPDREDQPSSEARPCP